MCLAIPGQIVEIVDDVHHIAKVDVGGVKRNVHYGLLAPEGIAVGDYVLIHVGFAMSKIDEKEAADTVRFMEELGQYEPELEQYKERLE